MGADRSGCSSRFTQEHDLTRPTESPPREWLTRSSRHPRTGLGSIRRRCPSARYRLWELQRIRSIRAGHFHVGMDVLQGDVVVQAVVGGQDVATVRRGNAQTFDRFSANVLRRAGNQRDRGALFGALTIQSRWVSYAYRDQGAFFCQEILQPGHPRPAQRVSPMMIPADVNDGSTASEAIDRTYLYMIVLVASVGGFLFGYDLSLMSGAIIFLEREFALTSLWRGLVMSSAILGCPVGPLAGVWMADAFGRKKTLIVASVLFMVSALGSAWAPNVTQLIIWRFVGGLGVGLASTISPMYIAEVAPARLRGRLVVANQLAIVIGLTMSVLVAYFLSFGGHWRWMFATAALPTVCLMIGLAFMPNSPRWLAAVQRDKEALRVLTKINGRARALRELEDIRSQLGEEKGGFLELGRPGIRLALAIGVALMVFSQINGVNMILLYTPTLFVEAGITDAPDAILNSVYIDVWITVCTVIAFWLTRTFGRRPLLIYGAIGMAVGHFLMFLSYTYQFPPLFTLVAMFVPTGAFTLTLAALSWVVLSEIFPNRVRGKAMSIATCAMFASSFLTATWFPRIMECFKHRLGHPGGTFLIFLGICLTCSLFVWLAIPETKDRTLEDIGRIWLHHDTRARGRAQSPRQT
jgi:sugar porter (SP) family MFS transporter